MYLSQEIRQRAKIYARNLVIFNFWACAGASVIALIIPFLGSMLLALGQPDLNAIVLQNDLQTFYLYLAASLVVQIVLFILNIPLLLGYFSWLSEMTMGRKRKLSYLFSWCANSERLKKSLSAAMHFIGRALLEGIKFTLIPQILLGISMYYVTAEQFRMLGVMVIALLLFIVGTVLALIRVIGNYPALYLLAAVPEMTASEAFSQCAQFMYNKKTELFKLVLSFIPWTLLEMLTYNVAGLFVKPYYYLAMLYFVQQIYNRWLYETGKVDQYIDPLINLFEGGHADV